MKRLFSLIVFLTVCVFPVQTRANDLQALPIVLKEKATVTDEYIRLGDLFTGLDEAADKKTVAPAPALGKEAVLTGEWLRKLANANKIGWEPDNDKFSVIVRRKADEVSKNDVLKVIVKELEAQGMPENAELTFQKGSFPVLVPVNSVWLLEPVSAEYTPTRRQFEAKLRLNVDAEKTKELVFAGKVTVFVSVPVAAGDLKTGRIITTDDVLMKRVAQENVRTADIVKKEDLIGKEVKKALKSGQQIDKNDVRAQIMVAKGKIVTLNFTKGGIMLSAQGKAHENGGLGDVVRVMNAQSKSVVQGIVTGPETVSVHTSGSKPQGRKTW